jgi:TetR/AcrR family transcriptional repressor of bet genes
MSPKVGMRPVRREQIVRATVRCLARQGYRRLTMKDLAREARVSQGILHYYFTDKQAILAAAFRAVTAALNRRVAIAQARGARDPRSRLRAVIGACFQAAVEEREHWIVFLQFWSEMLHDRELRGINAALYETSRSQLAELITSGIRAGTFREVNARHAAAVILGLVDGISLQLTFDDTFSVAAAVRFCDDALMRYLGTRSRMFGSPRGISEERKGDRHG